MKTFNFKKLDAFTTGASSGNPAGFVELASASEITAAEMQQIAFELKGFVSEVGFVSPGLAAGVDYNFRYFSCEKEVPFCGHATVAICYELAKNNPAIQAKPFFTIQTQKGILRIENKMLQENLVYIQAPAPGFIASQIDSSVVAAALNLQSTDIDMTQPLEIINAGQNVLLVALCNKEACINCAPDYQTLRAFSLKNNIEVINIYTPDTVLKSSNYRTRVFAPTFGYLEDPATGSGNAALGYFLIKHKAWLNDKLIIEQGPDKQNPNLVVLRKVTDTEVLIGGSAVTRINGEYLLA